MKPDRHIGAKLLVIIGIVGILIELLFSKIIFQGFAFAMLGAGYAGQHYSLNGMVVLWGIILLLPVICLVVGLIKSIKAM